MMEITLRDILSFHQSIQKLGVANMYVQTDETRFVNNKVSSAVASVAHNVSARQESRMLQKTVTLR